jgi:arginine repressor
MARKKIQFTEEQKQLIETMATSNKTLTEISDALNEVFGMKVTLTTISNQIKSMGIVSDNRRNKSTVFTTEEKNYIEIGYNLGLTVKDICEGLQQEYGKTVSAPTISKLIISEGYKQNEQIEQKEETYFDEPINEPSSDNSDMDTTVERTSNVPESLIQKMCEDPNIIRLLAYERNTPYNCENGKDTWFTRDGFPKINLSNSIYFQTDYSDYDTCAGRYRSQWLLDSDMKFYMFEEGEDKRGYRHTKKRLDIRRWYIDHKDRINELYDTIVESEYDDIPEVFEFNNLCKILFDFKIEFAEVLHGEDSPIVKMMRREPTNASQFSDFLSYMKYEVKEDI